MSGVGRGRGVSGGTNVAASNRPRLYASSQRTGTCLYPVLNVREVPTYLTLYPCFLAEHRAVNLLNHRHPSQGSSSARK
jgi:hypothetical protein